MRVLPLPLLSGRTSLTPYLRRRAHLAGAGLAMSLALLAIALVADLVAGPAKTSRSPKRVRAAKLSEPSVKDTVVARVGSQTVTLASFRREWDRVFPGLRPLDPSPLRARQLFLEDLITRNLLAVEALANPKKLPAGQEKELAELKERLVRNALYQKEVVDAVQVDDADLDRLSKELTKVVSLRGFWFREREPAQAWYTRLVSGTPLARLRSLAASDAPGAPRLLEIGFVTREEMTEAMSRVVFDLAPLRWGEPIPYQQGWLLPQVTEIRPRPLPADARDRQGLADQARQLRSAERREEQRRQMAKELRVQYTEAALDTILKRFLALPPRFENSQSGPGTYHAFQPMPTFSRDDSSLVLATTLQGKVTGADLAGYLNSISAVQRSEVRTRGDLVSIVDRVALDSELLARAKRLGLEKDPSVVWEMARRRESFLVETLYEDSVRSRVVVREDSLRAIFDADSARFGVREGIRVWSCVVERRTLADSLLAQARAGADLETLARNHSIIEESAKVGGTSGLFSRGESQSPEVENQAFALPVGGFGGPTQIPDGWMIFKVMEKRPPEPASFEKARETIILEFRAREEERLMQAFLTRLRARIPVESHPERLAALVPAEGTSEKDR